MIWLIFVSYLLTLFFLIYIYNILIIYNFNISFLYIKSDTSKKIKFLEKR